MSDDDNLLGLDIEEEDSPAFDPEFAEDLEDDSDDPLDDDDDELEEDEKDAPPKPPAAKRPPQVEGEFDDEVDPDNLEADLNTILRDRLSPATTSRAARRAGDGREPASVRSWLGSVTPRRDDEWLCEGCFLLVSKSQLGSRKAPRCPSGEEICPSLDRLGP